MGDRDLISGAIKLQLEALASETIEIKKILKLGTTSLTPINYSEEMEKFDSSLTYNPQYIYKNQDLPDVKKQIDKLKIKVENLDIPQDLREYLLEFLDDQYLLYLTKKSIGTYNFSKNAKHLFDWGTDRLDMILTNTPAVKFKMYIKHKMVDAAAIKNEFEQSLVRYKINGFKVRIDEFTPHIISVGYKTISIGNQIRRFECNVERLIVHEIESHVLQTQNTKISNTRLSELVKYGSQNLYGEGLAIHNEINTRKITPSAYETYFYRIKAVRNLNKSFREIYEILLKNLDPAKAFVMTYRVKRGMADTSLAGGFPKDASYLLGYHEIENLVSEKYSKKLLYATKSPILSTLLNKYNYIDMDKILVPKFGR